MKTLVLSAVALATMSGAALAQGWDRDHDRREWRYEHRHRDDNPGERILRGAVRGLTGDYGPRCRVVVTRHREWDGDMVVTRRRVCR